LYFIGKKQPLKRNNPIAYNHGAFTFGAYSFIIFITINKSADCLACCMLNGWCFALVKIGKAIGFWPLLLICFKPKELKDFL
jgi:hypothetical protein